jgi:hypothetical protein
VRAYSKTTSGGGGGGDTPHFSTFAVAQLGSQGTGSGFADEFGADPVIVARGSRSDGNTDIEACVEALFPTFVEGSSGASGASYGEKAKVAHGPRMVVGEEHRSSGEGSRPSLSSEAGSYIEEN